jgi:hypothetical protein
MVPTKAPGTIFSALTGGDTTLNIRWLTAADPAFFDTLNRPLADLAVRQLVIAKAVDNLQLRLGHDTLFPFIVQPRVTAGTTELDVPIGWIWDFQASLPQKWENVRLAKIKRISGENSVTEGYSGRLRLIFTANVENSTTEVAVLQADYTIASPLTYQQVRLESVLGSEEVDRDRAGRGRDGGRVRHLPHPRHGGRYRPGLPGPSWRPRKTPLTPPGMASTTTRPFTKSQIRWRVVRPLRTISRLWPSPTVPVCSPTAPGMPSRNWTRTSSRGLPRFNYPFDADANRTSTTGIVIPNGLFREFDIAAPAGDLPTADTTGTFYPVWINRVERIGTGGNQLRFYFATYNVTDLASGGAPSTATVEFASLDLTKTMTPGEVVEIVPVDNLQLHDGEAEFGQHFGRVATLFCRVCGTATPTTLTDFFAAFDLIVNSPPDSDFSQSATRISSFGLSRVPKYIADYRGVASVERQHGPPGHADLPERYESVRDGAGSGSR